jgi:hypothetical protein
MTTQTLYQKTLNEQMTQSDFLWTVRRDPNYSGILTNTMTFEDTVKTLKNKGFIWDNKESEVKSFDFIGTMKSLNEGAKKQKLKGGKGDNLTPDQVNYHEFTKGWKHELEHTDDIDKAKEIALDHLAEDPNYYTRLDMIEFQAKKKNRTDLPIDISKKNSPKKDPNNQMVPADKKKVKPNVADNQGKKEKARSKSGGVKKMKGGYAQMKAVNESVDEAENPYASGKGPGRQKTVNYGLTGKVGTDRTPAGHGEYGKHRTASADDIKKSAFKEGAIHEIMFDTASIKDIKKQRLTIYRKLDEHEYKMLKSSHKINASIVPSDKSESYQDVYIFEAPRKNSYGKRGGDLFKYRTNLSAEEYKNIPEDIKEALVLEKVPIEDIVLGLDMRPMPSPAFKDLLEEVKRRMNEAEEPKISNRKENEYNVYMTLAGGVEKVKKGVKLSDQQVSKLKKQYGVTKVVLASEDKEKNTKDKEYIWKKKNDTNTSSGTLSDDEFKKLEADPNVEFIGLKSDFDKEKAASSPAPSTTKKTVWAGKKAPQSSVANITKGSAVSKPEGDQYRVQVKIGDKWVDSILTDTEIENRKKKGYEVKKLSDTPIGKTGSKTLVKTTDPTGKEVGAKAPEKKTATVAPKDKKTTNKDDASANYNFYVEDKNKKQVYGFNDLNRAKELVDKNRQKNYRIISRVQAKGMGYIKEDFSSKDKSLILNKKVNFIIPSSENPDTKEEVSTDVKSASFNKKKQQFNISTSNGGKLSFSLDPRGVPVGVFFKGDGKSYKVLDILPPLTTMVSKVFKNKGEEETAEDTVLEQYIRKRIQKALSEDYSDLGAYMGYIGPEVKKKKLDDLMKRYEWGYQTSDDPAVRDRGQQYNRDVARYIYELGEDGIKIFNSYAPDGYQISNVDDLGGDAQTKSGLPQDRAFNPNALTMRESLSPEEQDIVKNAKRWNDPNSKEFKSAKAALQALVAKYKEKDIPKEILDAIKQMSDLDK